MNTKSMWVLSLLIISASFTQETMSVSVDDFSPAYGKWKGSLTYLDYSSGKPYTMPADVTIEPLKAQIVLAYEYPKEPQANGTDTLKITSNGTMIDGAKVVSKRVVAKGKLEIITEATGVDGNEKREALIRHTFAISWDLFSIRKDVKFKGENNWIKRNEYSFSK
jgi:hypothetical protein